MKTQSKPAALLAIGQSLPQFSVLDQDGISVSAADFKGQWSVLYLYPRDLTPGCTTEAQDFTRLMPEFSRLGAQILGCSTDTPEKHCRFIEKSALAIRLLSDSDHVFIEDLGAWQLKKFMGRESMGVIRTTWLLDPKGVVHAVWSPVKVNGHAQEVLNTLQKAQA